MVCDAIEGHVWVIGPDAVMAYVTTEGHKDLWSVLQPEAMLMSMELDCLGGPCLALRSYCC